VVRRGGAGGLELEGWREKVAAIRSGWDLAWGLGAGWWVGLGSEPKPRGNDETRLATRETTPRRVGWSALFAVCYTRAFYIRFGIRSGRAGSMAHGHDYRRTFFCSSTVFRRHEGWSVRDIRTFAVPCIFFYGSLCRAGVLPVDCGGSGRGPAGAACHVAGGASGLGGFI